MFAARRVAPLLPLLAVVLVGVGCKSKITVEIKGKGMVTILGAEEPVTCSEPVCEHELPGGLERGQGQIVASRCVQPDALEAVVARSQRGWDRVVEAAEQEAGLLHGVTESLDVEILECPTQRDGDGVALSSRNARLSASEREAARAIPRALEAGERALADGGSPADVVGAARAVLEAEADVRIDYVTLADAQMLPVEQLEGEAWLLIAAWVGEISTPNPIAMDQRRSRRMAQSVRLHDVALV